MPMKRTPFLHTILVLSFLFLGCVNPVEPEFEFKEGLIYVDALATTTVGTSYVTISETKTEFGFNKTVEVSGAQVYFINSNTGDRIALIELEGAYFPPEEFKIKVGQIWELKLELEDGRNYRSEREVVQPAVEVLSIDVTYKPELLFSEALGTFVPGHEISTTFNDPIDQENYYYWRFKSHEKLIYCRECYTYTILRNEECFQPNPNGGGPPLKEYYTYSCEEDCWRLRYNERIEIFSDEFVNGKRISQLPIGAALLYTKDNMLIELQQFSISSKAYSYYKTLKDIVDNNGGFNSPLPAALLGNIYNPNNTEEFVLGIFAAASSTVTSKFVERIFIDEQPLEQRIINSPEEDEAPAPIVSKAPCFEGRYRSAKRPDGWMD